MLKFIFLALPLAIFAQNHEEVFTEVYQKALWGTNAEGKGWSGGGSSAELSKPYREYLEAFFQEHDIQSIVDVGSGDWESTKMFDFSQIDYIGFDVVKEVIDRNQEQFGAGNIKFVHANFLEIDLPEADLLICKHVCQHITNQDVFTLLKQTNKFKHCIFVNPLNPASLTSSNPDTEVSAIGRCIDLTKPPFNLEGNVEIYSHYDGGAIQQILHVDNTK